MYQRIVVPTDGSGPSDTAAEHAVELADRYGAELDTVYVVEETGAPGHWDVRVEDAEAAGKRALESVERLADERGVPVEKHLRRGRPHEEIIDAAEAYGADLIVMGTHGRTGFDRFATAGSTTERVVRYTGIHVLVVGGAGES